MQGQLNVFSRYVPEKIEYAIKRYENETKRLYCVLNRQLEKYEYLAGDYSIADIATWPWVYIHKYSGIDIEEFQNLKRWLNLIGERPAVKIGKNIPKKVIRTEKEQIEQLSKMLA